MAFSFFKKNSSDHADPESMWTALRSLDQWEQIVKKSHDTPQLIFKHSTRCGVSRMVLREFEREWQGDHPCYYLDLLAHRDVSNAIAESTGVLHQSPQIIILKEGKAIYDASHQSISAQESLAKIEIAINAQ
ncbi:MAG: bacillithiol system redox-active protein YtxJ [Flavobacteriales bacterium]|nr:bacillithiol system redox-active protein YtxJ [Flavobacteriales bacterium]